MSSPIISAEALNALLNENAPDLVVVDSRHDLTSPGWGRQAFAQGHIPGAVFVSIDDDLSGKPTGTNGRHPLPSPEALARTLGRLGIGNHSRVIVYDQGNTMFAGRLWWILRWLGHANTQVLDGGLAAWQQHAYPVETGAGATLSPTTFIANEQSQWLRTAKDIETALEGGQHLIVDARAPERYRGEVEPLDRVAGHIPGALNRPFTQNQRDGIFKPAEELHAEFADLLKGKAPEQVIHQCGSGVSAISNILAMEHAGLTGSALYAGSWSEWCSNPDRPVATGPNPA